MTVTALKFITQPISTLFEFSQNTKAKIKNHCEIVSFGAKLYGKPLPPDVEGKIKKFIDSELHVDSSNLVLRVDSAAYPAFAAGSTRVGKGLVVLSPEFVEEIKTELNAVQKFVIAHELGHLENDDCNEGNSKLEIISQAARLGTYSIIALTSPFSFIATHLLGCISAKCVDLYARKIIRENFELRADLFAAKHSSEIASGGIDSMRKRQQENLDGKKKLLSSSLGLLTTLKKVALHILVSPSGDLRIVNFFSGNPHPSSQTRIDQLTPYLSLADNK